ncbi:MAG: ArsA family ATPase [Oligoflexia bacterium]
MAEILKRPIVFVSGKGGVGKTSVSQGIARVLSQKGQRTLWVGFEDPTRKPGELTRISRTLHHLNCEAKTAFEEYMGLKLRFPGLAHLFVSNPLIQFLAKAGPGIHELVLLGKLWFEQKNYDRIVADLPSTGYGLAMFQSIDNWARIFQGGPLYKDAREMIQTFSDPKRTGQLIVALPEEMPLRESLELGDYLQKIFPSNPAAYLVNRRFPDLSHAAQSSGIDPDPSHWKSPLADSLLDFALKRSALETHNCRIWSNYSIPFESLDWELPGTEITGIAEQLSKRGLA